MSATNSTLSALLSTTPHLLAYSIPLLLVSVPLTFAGTFLTLDRSRSFPSSYTPLPPPGTFDKAQKISKSTFSLQGGLGGLACGYVFGVHLSTFLSLLIPSASSSAPLSPNSFLAVWILSCVSTTFLGGRYRYCARLFGATSGGSSLALAIALIIHPSLLPRQVLTALLTVLEPLLVLLFSFPRLLYLLRPTLRVATTSSGAFSLTLSIAALAHIPPWTDIWERLWLQDGDTWGSSKEKGLSSVYCVLLVGGIATDWALNRWLGECPDEKWDNYLATYSASLPNDASRAGNFKPLPRHSLWGRLFGFPARTGKDDILCPLSPPPAKHTRSSMAKDPVAFMSDDEHIAQQPLSKYDDLPPSPTFLKKARSQNTKFRPMKKPKNFQSITSGRKQPIKFGENLSSDSSDSESDPNRGNARPWLKSKVSLGSSSPTLVDEPTRHPEDVLDIELGKLKKARQKAGDGVGGMPEYSDYEEDLGSPRTEVGTQEGQVGWSPGFMKQSSSIAARGNSRSVDAILSTGGPHGVLPLPMGAVPATPSLIKALDRISAAQRDAFSAEVVVSTPTSSNDPSSNHPSSYSRNQKGSTHAEGLPKLQDHQTDGLHEVENTHNRAPMWEQFWREVRHKAQS